MGETEDMSGSETKVNGTGSGFASRMGFILAAAGSAVGLGNIWRFPYLAAKYGGGFFLLVYIILAVTFGFSLMLTELAIGRRTGKSVLGAYREVHKKFGFMGWVAAFIPAVILPYYCVIGGWVMKYMVMFVTGQGVQTAETVTVPGSSEGIAFFSDFIGHSASPTIYFVIFVLLTAGVILLGVQKGIEKVSKILMPILFFLLIVIDIYTLTLDGALDGAAYYLLPDFSDMSAEKAFQDRRRCFEPAFLFYVDSYGNTCDLRLIYA